MHNQHSKMMTCEVNMPRHAVDIGNGSLEALVEGDGPVTVVFENGIATPLEQWDMIAPRIATRARVVRYDHRYAPPVGEVSPRSVSEILSDLEKLLNALEVPPPYVLVGHSWGGVIARLFTHAHPADIAGAVFVDATHEAVDARTLKIVPAMYSLILFAARARWVRRGLIKQLCPPGSSPAYRARIEGRLNDLVRWPVGLRTARAESAAIPAALDRLRRDCPDLPAIPIRVLAAEGVKSKSAEQARRGWQAAVARATRAHYTSVPTSSHQLPIACPDVVVDAIWGVLDETGHLRPIGN
jgi:pimeloyl-ACP methyl ester carboxylesterase